MSCTLNLSKIELDWDYEQGKVHLSMKPYLQKALHQFDNITPSKRQNSPYPHTEINYGQTVQFAEYDSSPSVGAEEQKRVQQVNGKLPLSALTAQQAKPTTATMAHVKQFFDYCATQEPAVLTYCKSDMVLAAGYLNESSARSQAGDTTYCLKTSHSP